MKSNVEASMTTLVNNGTILASESGLLFTWSTAAVRDPGVDLWVLILVLLAGSFMVEDSRVNIFNLWLEVNAAVKDLGLATSQYNCFS